MSDKKSIFTNLEEFNKQEEWEEEVLEFDVEEFIDEGVVFPIYEKAGTRDIIENILGTKPKKLLHALPDIILPEVEASPTDSPIDLSELRTCPRCNSVLVHAIAINGSESDSFKECPSCGTLINTFKPIGYQAEYAARNELYTMLAGGFGSGKSRINIEKIISHLVLIQGARVVVAARTYPAIEATFVKDFFSIMPASLLRRKNEQKKEWIFTNGSELLLRSFDDPTKLRGINATMFVLLEASNIQYEGFELAQNRIRNTAALLPEYDLRGKPVFKYDEKAKAMRPVYKYDARRILIETNPDSGWVKKQFLLDSSNVIYYGSAYNEGYRMNTATDPNKYTLVMATDANPYLPENFIMEQTRGKSKAYVQQFFFGSFNFSDNLVYPNAGAAIVEPKPLPPEYDEYGRRALWYIIGLDYGVSDALAIIYGAYSSITKKIYLFDEIYERGLDVRTASQRHKDKLKLHGITNAKLMFLPLFDGRSYNKRQADLQTIGDLFNLEGLFFTPSFTSVDARVAKLNGMINSEQIEIFSTLEFFIEEITNYKWAIKRDGTPSGKPEDKNNHAINAGEFIIMALPLDLNNFDMKAYVPTGTIHIHNYDENKTVKTKPGVFNPYEGGNKNDRHSTNRFNNLYANNDKSTGRRRVNDFAQTQRDNTYDSEDDNLFRAYIPNRRK